MSEPSFHEARIHIAAGARATEALLLACLEPLVAAARADWRLLAKPVRIVVPSRSLRDHVAATLVRHFGSAVAGVQIQTLQGLAREVLERMHESVGAGEALLPILVRAAAQREPALETELGVLRDGFGAVVGTVRDLLDAGCVAENASVIEEALVSLPATAAARERACALVRVTRDVTRVLEKLGIDSRASLLRRAQEALVRDPERALPQRAVLVHGFADATGVATDWIEALLRSAHAQVLLDRPPDPADPVRPDLGCAFTEHFAGRLQAVGSFAEAWAAPDASPLITLLEAPGAEAEVRGIAVRVRGLLDAGVAPEAIGVVARSLSPFATRVRADFDRLGIPFSTFGVRGGLDGVGRRIQALLELLERGAETSVDRWLDALAPLPTGVTLLADLRMALHRLGAARLDHVAALDLEERLQGKASLALPVRHGIRLAEDENGEPTARADRRHVPREALASLVTAAQRVVASLGSQPEEAQGVAQLDWLRSLVNESLRWREDEPARGPLLEALDRLGEDLATDLPIGPADLLLLLREACEELGSRPLGGAGAGVQVLDATQARARTFSHLFVMGLNRDLFPRVVLEDPLLPDSIRTGLVEHGSGVVPDLPLKLGGFDEERYLFAQLLSASPRVTLSWQSMDDDGKERAASTLVERLRLGSCKRAVEMLPVLWSARDSSAPRPAGEHAVLAGLHGSRTAFARILPLALGEAAAEAGIAASLDANAVAGVRMAALEVLEPRGASRDDLGPGFGFVGERRDGDERGGPLAVTTLENLARCPWQTFLRRVLHVEPGPDALDALPAVDALQVGSVLHATLEAIVKAATPGDRETLATARVRGAQPVPWPGDTEMRRLLAYAAEQQLLESGLAFPGLARILAERVEPLVREVFAQLWHPSETPPTFFGAELRGTVRVSDREERPREISFRADLAQESGGVPRLIDLKSGKPISGAKGAPTQRRHLLRAIARGRSLQAVAYACAVEGEGQYLYADRERAPYQKTCTVTHDTPDVLEAFDEVMRTLLSAWDSGSFLPRLEMPEGVTEPPPCEYCEVSEACVRGDSGARMRLRRWAAGSDSATGPSVNALAAARAVFRLPGRTGDAAAAASEEEA